VALRDTSSPDPTPSNKQPNLVLQCRGSGGETRSSTHGQVVELPTNRSGSSVTCGIRAQYHRKHEVCDGASIVRSSDCHEDVPYCCTPRYRTADLRYLVVGQSQVVTIKFGTF